MVYHETEPGKQTEGLRKEMATITRSEKMFGLKVAREAQIGVFDRVCRVIARILMPGWIIAYAEEKAAEIRRKELYHT